MEDENDPWVTLSDGSQTTVGTSYCFKAAHVARLLVQAGVSPEDAVSQVKQIARIARVKEARRCLDSARDAARDAEIDLQHALDAVE